MIYVWSWTWFFALNMLFWCGRLSRVNRVVLWVFGLFKSPLCLRAWRPDLSASSASKAPKLRFMLVPEPSVRQCLFNSAVRGPWKSLREVRELRGPRFLIVGNRILWKILFLDVVLDERLVFVSKFPTPTSSSRTLERWFSFLSSSRRSSCLLAKVAFACWQTALNTARLFNILKKLRLVCCKQRKEQ
jgi:hypothetical protein